MALLTVSGAVGCGGESASGVLGTGGSGGNGSGGGPGGSGGTGMTTTTSTVATTGPTSVSSSGSGGSPNVDCNPPAEAGSLYALEDEGLFDIGKSSMCKYRGDVLLIVNMAGA